MPSLSIARKKKLEFIHVDLTCKKIEVQTDERSLPCSLRLMTQRKPSSFTVKSCFKTFCFAFMVHKLQIKIVHVFCFALFAGSY